MRVNSLDEGTSLRVTSASVTVIEAELGSLRVITTAGSGAFTLQQFVCTVLAGSDA